MRLTNYFIIVLIVLAGTFRAGHVQAKSDLKIDHEQISGIDRGAGDSVPGQSKTDKPIHFRNKCKSKVRANLTYLNKSGQHKMATILAPKQFGSSQREVLKAHTVRAGGCKKLPGGEECTLYIDSKARKWLIKACK